MLDIVRNVVRFFVECLEALRDDDVEQPAWNAQQQRRLDYLSPR
jgi:hypothetical protein